MPQPSGAIADETRASLEPQPASRKSVDLRTDFVTAIGHDLKTPAGALVALADAMQGEQDVDALHRLALWVLREAERMAGMVEELLDVARRDLLDPGEQRSVSIDRVLREAIERSAAAAHARDVRLHVVGTPTAALIVGSHRHLVSAAGNLLENAIKYSDEHACVLVKVLADEQWIDLRVEDRGLGIPTDEIDHVFDRLFRGRAARDRAGSGLGLAIVRCIAAAHGGDVTVTSEEGQGSIFTLRLPAAPVTDGAR